MTTTAIIPYRPTDEWRGAAFDHVLFHLRDAVGDPLTGLSITVADDPHETFNRGRAINNGVAESSGDVLIFADADLWVPPAALRYALSVVNEYGMVVPFDHLIGLDEWATGCVLGGSDPAGVWPAENVELDWRQRSVGGCNVMRRDVFDTVGGFDEAMEGWGSEDSAFEAAVSTLGGPVGWVPARAVHLYHPSDPTRGTDMPAANAERADLYQAAYGDVDAMRALVEGARV